ncbi:MAG: hypothetical protein JSU83_16210 [Deltaproteobacteria bacterium]|nr:MAG: hypothetical protein JSU83_16210 [Deltaproteobacteria bacterium]
MKFPVIKKSNRRLMDGCPKIFRQPPVKMKIPISEVDEGLGSFSTQSLMIQLATESKKLPNPSIELTTKLYTLQGV